ncbi:cytochrome P450 704B1 [Diospyros lotus]|uniref:cytochrome P450 704B1 n=1 Tax=Diospyros lotus TaxID=55363 RepID=UPI00225B1128|nr:cytochrome P450 704B1 [Diospyros lotus]
MLARYASSLPTHISATSSAPILFKRSKALQSLPTTATFHFIFFLFSLQMETEINLPSFPLLADGHTMAILTLACMLASWILIHRWNQRNTKGPRTWPLVGAAIEQFMNYDRMHDWLVNYLSESKTVVVPMPFTTYTYIADPANVEHVLKTNFPNYPKGEVYHSYMEVLLGDGIFNADGELWRKQRKTASFEFASKNLRDFSTVVFRDYSLKLSAILNQASLNEQELDMQELFMRMTLDSICKVGFGVEIGTLAAHLPENSFARAFDSANIIVTLRFIDPLWKIKKFLNVGSEAVLDQSIKVIDDFTYSVIRRRKTEMKATGGTSTNEKMKHDILSRFIELGKDPENNITDKSLRDVVLNFVIAGRDTTATTLSWAMYMIMTNSHVADKLYSELKSFEEDRAKEEKVSLFNFDTEDPESFNKRTAQFAQLLTYDSLGRLAYLHAVITETLRLYPAVPQDPKGIMEDDVLPDGTKVKAGGMVTYVPYSMGRMEYNWGPDAASFKPERWLKEGFFQNASPFKFTAFQAGPRICLGKDSAYLQMKIALAILCRFFKFSLVPGHPVKYRMMTILSMAHGLKVTVSRRLCDF